MKIEEVKQHVEKLYALLKEPEPGIFTWSSMVNGRIEEIVCAWFGISQEDFRNSIIPIMQKLRKENSFEET